MHRFGEVPAHRTSSNLHNVHPHRERKVYSFQRQEFGVVRLDRTFSDYIFTGDRSAICTEVQAHRTASNLIKLHPHRDSKVERFLLQEFGVVQLDRTFSDYIFTGDRSARSTSSMRFKNIEPHRTFSNYILTERGRYIDFFYMSSALFDWTEPSLTASLQGLEGVQGALCTSWMRFKHIEPHRTSNCILTELARYIDFFHMSLAWFDCTTPSPTTSLQGLQGVQGASCTSSGRFKHIEPHRTFSSYLLTDY